MAITTQQRTNLRLDAGLPDDETVFSNDEMETIWERVSGASSDADRHAAALGLMSRQLLYSANKLHDYRLVNTAESLSQVRKHLKEMYDEFKPALEAALGVTYTEEIAFSAMRPVERHRDRPYGNQEGWEPLDPILRNDDA